MTCTEIAEIASSYNTAIAKVDAILQKLAEISNLETPPTEVAEFCATAASDFAALK